ncbi:MAG: deoxyribodipyrimidine photolyase [Gemmatimonadota bacterium]
MHRSRHRSTVPSRRVRALNAHPLRDGARYVLYWMVAQRRLGWNFALDRALDVARARALPLVIFEPLRAGYRWAAVRHHRFVVEGMAEHAASLAGTPVTYVPWIEPEPGAGRGLLEWLARDAALVVTDDYPAFFLPRMLERAGDALDVRLEAVDSNGLLPLRAAPQAFATAFALRRHLQTVLPEHLADRPEAVPDLADLPRLPVPLELPERWASATAELLRTPAAVDRLPIDARVGAIPSRGGTGAARARLAVFLAGELDRYPEDRRHPDRGGSSGLSPWLHWGHLSAHEVFAAVAEREGWTPLRLSDRRSGARQGWWGMSEAAEGFLDELVTWRELGFNTCAHLPGYDRWESLPEWARGTLETHAADPRPHVYSLEAFEAAETHDPLWNAAQRQLRAEGRIHNYLRMLWGKKVLEWSPDPRTALTWLIELNNRWAIDGRDPNSWSGIFWTFGRYDRGWPERPIFGTIRSMTSASTRRKVEVDDYLLRFGGGGA